MATAAPAGFSSPDYSVPLDVNKYIEACPPDVTTRGMFFNDIINAVSQRNLPPATSKKYAGFGSYPAKEWIQLAADAAGRIFPGVPQRAGLVHLGRLAYPTFKETMIGRVMYSALNNDVEKILKIAPRSYRAAISRGDGAVVSIDKDHCHLKLTDFFTYVDSYQVGVIEGVVISCGAVPDVKIKVNDHTAAEVFITWHHPKA